MCSHYRDISCSCRQASTTSTEPSTSKASAMDPAAPQSRLPAGWQPNLQRLLSDIVPMLSMELRSTFRELVKDLRAKREAGEIHSLSGALMGQAPQVVGDLWQQCIDRQREEAVRQAAAAGAPAPPPREANVMTGDALDEIQNLAPRGGKSLLYRAPHLSPSSQRLACAPPPRTPYEGPWRTPRRHSAASWT